MITKKDIVNCLKKVIDPDVGINIIDMGFIYRVDIFDHLEIDYTLTSMGCPLADVIEDDIRNNLKADFKDIAIKLNLVWEPAWHIDFLSEDARVELGYPI